LTPITRRDRWAMESDKPLNIAIIGTGISGLSAA
jgi:predicted NAD/FAD-binding protein